MTIVLRVDTDGCATLHRIKAGDLTGWQGLVGGYLEQIRPTTTMTGWAGYCDEEGMLRQLTPNPAASLLAGMLGWPGRHAIAGPVVFFGEDGSPDERDVPQPLVDVARVLLPVAWQDDLVEPVLRDRSDDRSALDPLRAAVAGMHDRHLRYGWDTDASLVPRMCWLRRLPEQSALTVTPMPGVFRDNNWRAGAAYVIDAVHSHKVWDGYAGVAFTSEHWVVTGPVEQMAEAMQLSEARKLHTHPERVSARTTIAVSPDGRVVHLLSRQNDGRVDWADTDDLTLDDEAGDSMRIDLRSGIPAALSSLNDRILAVADVAQLIRRR